jgi:hypothetical protein
VLPEFRIAELSPYQRGQGIVLPLSVSAGVTVDDVLTG